MPADPKRPRIKLSQKDYHELRDIVYLRCLGHCEICEKWMAYDEMALHHDKTKGAGGDDSLENCIGICAFCHEKKHKGLI